MNLCRRQKVYEIKKRDVVLFGAGDYARQFYREFKDELNIIGCITNNKNEMIFCVDEEEICPIYRVSEINCLKNVFVVVCAREHHIMQEQLKIMGLTYGRDFLDSGLVRMLFSEKKLAVFYGVCYIRAIYTCLQHSEGFLQQYESHYWLDYMQMDAVQKDMFLYLLKICDVYITNAFLSADKRWQNKLYMDCLPKECSIITIPMLGFNGYYPCSVQEIGKDNLYSVTSAVTPYAPFITPDHQINRMIEEGKSLQQVIDCISDVNYYKKEDVIKNYRKEMRKLEMTEQTANIKICDYLYEKHRKERIFLNEKHISNTVVAELASRILEKLCMVRDIDKSVLQKRLLYTSEVPVYPAVIEALQLDVYKGSYTLYTFKGDVEVTFTEYIERYYEYSKTMRRYMEEGYFPYVEANR